MENDIPLVSIIIVNFNRVQDTIELLNSIKEISYQHIECIVVDNGSTEGDIDQISIKFPSTILIKNNVNLGFAAANNIGINSAKGKYLLLLNNDIIVSPDFLQPLVDKFDKSDGIGIVSPKIYYHDKPDILQYAGYTEINSITIRNKGIGFNEIDTGLYNSDAETYFSHGAAFMFPEKIINQTGLMSEAFFLYYEELDWCKRVRNLGYKIFYVHNSVVYHKDSKTIGTDSPFKTYYLHRGRLIYMRRNIKFPLLILSTVYQLFLAFPKNLLQFILQKKSAHAKAYTKAFAWFIIHFFDRSISSNNP